MHTTEFSRHPDRTGISPCRPIAIPHCGYDLRRQTGDIAHRGKDGLGNIKHCDACGDVLHISRPPFCLKGGDAVCPAPVSGLRHMGERTATGSMPAARKASVIYSIMGRSQIRTSGFSPIFSRVPLPPATIRASMYPVPPERFCSHHACALQCAHTQEDRMRHSHGPGCRGRGDGFSDPMHGQEFGKAGSSLRTDRPTGHAIPVHLQGRPVLRQCDFGMPAAGTHCRVPRAHSSPHMHSRSMGGAVWPQLPQRGPDTPPHPPSQTGYRGRQRLGERTEDKRMLRTYAGDTFCRVCQVNECLVNEELCSCIFMLPDLFQNCIPWQKGSGRVIGIADELRHAFILPDNRDATSAIDRGSIFPKGMRGGTVTGSPGFRVARQKERIISTDPFPTQISSGLRSSIRAICSLRMA